MFLPQRKANRLKDYNYATAGAYFVTICVKNRQSILDRIVGSGDLTAPQVELSDFGMIADQYIKQIIGVKKYVIMPDHIHMIIEIDEADGAMGSSPPTNSISNRIKGFKRQVTHELGVSIFQPSYHDHIIRGKQDYEEIWNYIDENPLRWLLKEQNSN